MTHPCEAVTDSDFGGKTGLVSKLPSLSELDNTGARVKTVGEESTPMPQYPPLIRKTLENMMLALTASQGCLP